MTIAVSGATGQIGSRVARLLSAAGAPQRLILRDPQRAPDVAGADIAVITDYLDSTRLRAALEGVDAVLMVSGMEAADRLDQHRSFGDAAAAAGVGHIVYTSYYGASPTATFTHGRLHWHTEEYLRASGLPFTFLRDNLYADYLPYLAGADGVIRGPGGSGRLTPVAQDDVAEVAALVLQDPSAHVGQVHDLTGPDSLSFDDIAAILSATGGTPVRYHQETIDEAYASRASYDAEPWLVDAWVSTYTAIAAGEMDGVSEAVREVTGHPATPMAVALERRRS